MRIEALRVLIACVVLAMIGQFAMANAPDPGIDFEEFPEMVTPVESTPEPAPESTETIQPITEEAAVAESAPAVAKDAAVPTAEPEPAEVAAAPAPAEEAAVASEPEPATTPTEMPESQPSPEGCGSFGGAAVIFLVSGIAVWGLKPRREEEEEVVSR